MPRALVVDDDADTLDAMNIIVSKAGFETQTARDLASARRCVEKSAPDVALVDLQLPDGSGLDLAPILGEAEVILITGHATLDTAIEALRGGASDYLTKPVDLIRLEKILVGVREKIEMLDEISALRTQLRELGRFERFVGSSQPMKQVYDLIVRVAPTMASVLVTGETGTGKELVARTIHDLSSRSGGPFVAVNCGAIPKELIGSELFGYQKGAFTGAQKNRKGYFERADGGTIFLDEITEMPLDQQVNLLRVLETRCVTRLGGDELIPIDVRVVAATNLEPRKALKNGLLREDLMYRLMGFPLELPPLRERGDDIRMLAQHYLDSLNRESEVSKSITPAALDLLQSQSWPGNVRELGNVIQRAWIVANGRIRVGDIPIEGARASAGSGDTVEVSVGSSIVQAEKQLILATLDKLGGDKGEAARVLGISLKTLYSRLHRYKGV